MLKWERKKKTLTLSYKEKKRFFTKTLLLTLGIALGFHLAFLFLFSIDLGMLKDPVEPPPLSVTATLPGLQAYSEKEVSVPLQLSYLEENRKQSPEVPFYFSYIEEVPFRAAPMTKRTWKSSIDISRGIAMKQQAAPPLEISSYDPPHGSLLFEADASTGKIYYYVWKESTGISGLDTKIEEYVKGLTLEFPSEVPIAQGDIEVWFHD